VGVKAPKFLVALERQTLSGQTVRCYDACAPRDSNGEPFPASPIEFSNRTGHSIARSGLPNFQNLEQLASERIVDRSELFQPRLEDLQVPEGAQGLEQFPREPLHRDPVWIAVHFHHDAGDGPTTANRHAEVMNGLGVSRLPNPP
jgi:hypothetical protein